MRFVATCGSDGRAVLVLPGPALEELARVLRTKLGLDAEGVSSIAAVLQELTVTIADAAAEIHALSGDPDDDRTIAASIAGGAEVLVSGDRKHVLPLD